MRKAVSPATPPTALTPSGATGAPASSGAPGAGPALRRVLPLGVLVAGDAISFLVFAGAGRRTHNETSGLGALGSIAITALPFALGWFLVSPFAGAFSRALVTRPVRMLARTELAWAASWPVALALRWALSADHQIPVSFAIVTLVTNAVFLGAWRTAFALIARARRRSAAAV